MHGAQVVAVQGNFDDALSLVRMLTEKYPITLVNSVNPYRIEGQKTAAFEIVDALGRRSRLPLYPRRQRRNITAYWKGFKEYRSGGSLIQLPRMMGYQAAGAAPIVAGTAGRNTPRRSRRRSASATPPVGKGRSRPGTSRAGSIDAVTDEEIVAAYQRLAATEGIFCEPASAASLAGLDQSESVRAGSRQVAGWCVS